MPRIEEIERRLLNWARWRTGRGGGLGYGGASSWMAGVGNRGRYREATIPTIDCDAEATDRAIATLPQPLQDAVHTHYTSKHGIETQAHLLQIGSAALHARIVRAHELLAAHFNQVAAAAQAERARVEAVVQSARRTE